MRVGRLTTWLWEQYCERYYERLYDCFLGYRRVRQHPQLRQAMTYLVEESLAYSLVHYDPSVGVEFMTFARRTMEGRVRHFLRSHSERGRMAFIEMFGPNAKIRQVVDYPVPPETKLVFQEVMDLLDAREQQVMYSVVAQDCRVTDVAAQMGVTRDTVYRLKASAMQKIRRVYPEACPA